MTLGLNVDRKRISESEITSVGGQAIQVPVQTLVDVPAGMHTAGLAVSARYNSGGPGDVLVSAVSVIASAFPRWPSVNEVTGPRLANEPRLRRLVLWPEICRYLVDLTPER
jgi:hypothetical protein